MLKIVCYILLFLLAILIPFAFFARKFSNPYKLIMIFGKKGSGKTTLLTKLAYSHYKRGWKVFSTVDTPWSTTIRIEELGYQVLPPDSLLLVDEVGIIWDNRNYKSFRTDVRDYFKFQRQYRNKVYLFSQTFDVDLKLRNLTDSMYLCSCKCNVISLARRISRSITIVNPVGDAESRIADSLQFVSPFWQLFGGQAFIFTWIPSWSKHFASFAPPAKPFFPEALPGASSKSVAPGRFRPFKFLWNVVKFPFRAVLKLLKVFCSSYSKFWKNKMHP